jgi:hypothetical protein
MRSADLKTSLINHFSYLAASASDTALLEMIMARAERSIVEKDKFIVYFEGEDEPLEATPPMADVPAHFPESYKICLRNHQTVTFNGTTLGENEASNIDGYKEELEELGELGKEFAEADKLICPLNADGAYFFIYHPSAKRKDGSPQLYLVYPHDSPDITPLENPEEDVRTSFLCSIANQLGLPIDEE